MKNPKATTNRGVRLRCIFYAVKVLPKNQFQTIKSLVPEAIVCCKDINKRTRACAFRLLEEMFYIFRVRFRVLLILVNFGDKTLSLVV